MCKAVISLENKQLRSYAATHRTVLKLFSFALEGTRRSTIVIFLSAYLHQNCDFFVMLHSYTLKMTIFLSAPQLKIYLRADRFMFGRQTFDPNV
jgi:hypothetical protein